MFGYSRCSYRGLFLLSFFALMSLSCKSDIVNPVDAPPGRRDYIWKIDTLDMPMNMVNDIWGSSKEDVWTIGDMGMDLNKIMHYNGTSWKAYTKELISSSGGAIYGFNKDEAWLAGGPGVERGAIIWKWNGKNWSKNYHYDLDSYLSMFTDIWGTSNNDVYACGLHMFKEANQSRGFVLHYNGSGWKEIFLTKFNSQIFKIRKVNGKLILTSIEGSSLDSVSIYQLKADSLYKIYSDSRKNIRQVDFEVIQNQLYLLINREIFKVSDNNFASIFYVDKPNFGYRFCGRSENDIFLRMNDGLAHYNGRDIEYLYNFPLDMVNVRANHILFENDVFFCLWDRTKGYLQNEVLHGTLSNLEE